MKKEVKKIYFKDRNSWRNWLKDNHIKENKIAVIRYKKHTNTPSPTHQELMHEAICFGWIDTTVKRLDKNRYLINFSKRSKNSRWSDNTLSYAREMIKQGKMSEEGLNYYHQGLKRPSLDSDVSKNPTMPQDLKEALSKNKKAKTNFDNFAQSYKRVYLRWLERAKTKPTREKRINNIFNRALNNKAKFTEK
jgi:uncharacterized protein YdeI (YjbR/CyaY-like superfamily)